MGVVPGASNARCFVAIKQEHHSGFVVISLGTILWDPVNTVSMIETADDLSFEARVHVSFLSFQLWRA